MCNNALVSVSGRDQRIFSSASLEEAMASSESSAAERLVRSGEWGWSLSDAVCAMVTPRRQAWTQQVWAAWLDRFDSSSSEDLGVASLMASEPEIFEVLVEQVTGVKATQGDVFEIETGCAEILELRRPTIVSAVEPEWSAAFERWTTREKTVNFAGILESLGRETQVPVDDLQEAGSRRYVTVGEVVDDWGRYYLKDFLYRQVNHLENFAPKTPRTFRFRNWLSDDASINYNFLYLGPKGSGTRLHADVANSISWSASIAGRKLWRFLPPHQTPLLYDSTGRHTATDFRAVVLSEEKKPELWVPCRCSPKKLRCFPNLALAKPIEVIQEPGEIILVPSGWYHTVLNLDDALSINANVLEASNAHWALARLEKLNHDDNLPDHLSAPGLQALLLAALGQDLAAAKKKFLKKTIDWDLLLQIQRATAMLRLLAALDNFKLPISEPGLLEDADDFLMSLDSAPSTTLVDSFQRELLLRHHDRGIAARTYLDDDYLL